MLIGMRVQGSFSTLGKLNVVLIEDDVLHVVLRHVSHEQPLLCSLLVAGKDLVSVRQELEDLLEHRRHARK